MDSNLYNTLSPFDSKGKLRGEIAALLRKEGLDTSLPFHELVALAEAMFIPMRGDKPIVRWEIPDNTEMSPEQQEAAANAGLFNKRLPRAGHYDYVAVNCGTFMPVDRIFQLLGELVENNNYSFGTVVLLPSKRKLNPEKDAFEFLGRQWPGGVQPNKLWQPSSDLAYNTEADMVFDHMWPRSLTSTLNSMDVVRIRGGEAANTRTLFTQFGREVAGEGTILSISDAPHGPFQALAAMRGLKGTRFVLKDFAMTDGRYGLRQTKTMYGALTRWLSMWLKAVNDELV